MVRAGVFGELTHGECAYIHDLRSLLFENRGEGLWRRFEHFKRNGNLYPTHGLGPVALYMDVNRGDRFTRLVSMSSPSLGLAAWRDRNLPADDPRRKETYATGDMNTSLLQTAKGRTVVLQHDVVSPRPYSRINMLSGTLAHVRRLSAADLLRPLQQGRAAAAEGRGGGVDPGRAGPHEARGGRDRGPLRAPAVEGARGEGRGRAATAVWTTS